MLDVYIPIKSDFSHRCAVCHEKRNGYIRIKTRDKTSILICKYCIIKTLRDLLKKSKTTL